MIRDQTPNLASNLLRIGVYTAVSALCILAMNALALALGLPLSTGLALASACGWYSLSGILMTDAFGPIIGSAAFFNDLLRELLAIMLIPLLNTTSAQYGAGIVQRHFHEFYPACPAAQRRYGDRARSNRTGFFAQSSGACPHRPVFGARLRLSGRRPAAACHAVIFPYPCAPLVVPPVGELEKLAALLNEARNVTLMCGSGCADAHDEVVALVRQLKAPVVHACPARQRAS